jgi:hypothetical protein
MTDQIEFTDLSQAMAYCQKSNHQITASIAGTSWRLFPSGSSLTLSERFFHELDAQQQEHVIAIYTGKDLHQFAYDIEANGAVTARRNLR